MRVLPLILVAAFTNCYSYDLYNIYHLSKDKYSLSVKTNTNQNSSYATITLQDAAIPAMRYSKIFAFYHIELQNDSERDWHIQANYIMQSGTAESPDDTQVKYEEFTVAAHKKIVVDRATEFMIIPMKPGFYHSVAALEVTGLPDQIHERKVANITVY